MLIVGAGYVGCATALALEAQGLRVGVVDAKPPRTDVAPDWDVRVFTLSPGSEQLLNDLGVWPRLDASRLAAVYRMEVHGDDPAATMTFDAMRSGVGHLATVVEGVRLQAALEAQMADRVSKGVQLSVLAPAIVRTLDWGRDAVRLTLDDDRILSCRLLVGADGTESWVRTQARIGWHYRGYAQEALVANFSARTPHRGRAFQWFRHDGVLAFLPLPDHLMSIVWSTDPDNARRLLSRDARQLAQEVAQAADDALGSLTLVTAARSFPLRYARAHCVIANRVALVGDAAHSVHPLAGQGVNLGLRDAQALASALKERPAGSDVAELELLKKYQRARLEDTMSIYAVTDGLHKLFSASHPVLRVLRNRGMGMMDRLTPAKHALVRRALL